MAYLKALVHPLLLYMDVGTIGRWYRYQNGQLSWLKKQLCLITSIGGNTCPILTFSGFAKSPDPSDSFTHGSFKSEQLSDEITSEIAIEVGLFFIDVKLEKY